MSKKQSALLFVHGWATDKRVWEYQVNTIGNGCKSHSLDLPGHGGKRKWDESSLAPPVQEILSSLSGPAFSTTGKGVIGVGWSLGAQSLIACAAENKNKFSALILTGATPCFVSKDDFPWGQPGAIVKKMMKDIKKKPLDALKMFYQLNFTEEELKTKNAEGFINRYSELVPTLNLNEIAVSLEALYKTDLRSSLSLLDIPVLIIHGNKDRVCPVGAARYLADNIRNAEIKIFDNAGHAPFITEPDRFNKLIFDFVNRV